MQKNNLKNIATTSYGSSDAKTDPSRINYVYANTWGWDALASESKPLSDTASKNSANENKKAADDV